MEAERISGFPVPFCVAQTLRIYSDLTTRVVLLYILGIIWYSQLYQVEPIYTE